MPARLKGGNEFGRGRSGSRLEGDRPAVGGSQEPWRVDGGLDVHAEIQDVCQHLPHGLDPGLPTGTADDEPDPADWGEHGEQAGDLLQPAAGSDIRETT